MLVSCPSCHRHFDVGALGAGDRVRCPCGQPVELPAERREAPLRMLHCGTCGGRLEEGATACGYCSAQVALGDRGLGETCPECLARMLKDASYCSTCGVEIRIVSVPRLLQERTCPRCEGGLAELDGEYGRVVECLSCAGLWLDAETFGRFRSKNATASAGEPLKLNEQRKVASQASRRHPLKYIPCLHCGELMTRKQVPKGSGVVVDLCKDHGMWFDPQELEHVREYLRIGGWSRELTDAVAEAERARTAPRTPLKAYDAPDRPVWPRGSHWLPDGTDLLFWLGELFVRGLSR